jgi:hypothetical protein
MSKEYKTFNEFYPYYLSQHCNTYYKTLHFIGTSLVIALTISSIVMFDLRLLLYVPLAGYIFAWVGHYFFEKNKPATFKYPLFSLLSDFRMYYELLTLKIPFDSSIEK